MFRIQEGCQQGGQRFPIGRDQRELCQHDTAKAFGQISIGKFRYARFEIRCQTRVQPQYEFLVTTEEHPCLRQRTAG
jgi:hypothetical protein